jgi:D-lactate dehydrogenase (cytochrome)
MGRGEVTSCLFLLAPVSVRCSCRRMYNCTPIILVTVTMVKLALFFISITVKHMMIHQFRRALVSPSTGRGLVRQLRAAAGAAAASASASGPGPGSSSSSLSAALLCAAAASAVVLHTEQQSQPAARPPPLPEAFLEELRRAVGPDRVSMDMDDLEEHGVNATSYHKTDRMPDVVVSPRTTEEVAAVVKAAAKHGIPIVPFGGNTSTEGHTLSLDGGVSIDLGSMKQIKRLSKADHDVTVQAGLGYIELNDALREHGLWFPLDPGPGASVGGMCACRCSGSTAVRYGTMRDNVISLTAVLPSGEVIKTGARAKKSSAGYDLTRLLVGSEGTLALVTELTLKVHKIPSVSRALVMSFDSIDSAVGAVQDTIAAGIQVGRAEMMDDAMMKVINENNGTSYNECTTILVEIAGEDEGMVRKTLLEVANIARGHAPNAIKMLEDPAECRELWRQRKEALWATQASYPDLSVFITDVCVPISNLARLISDTKEELDKSWLPCPICAHAGDGNIHVLLMFDPNSDKDKAEVERLSSLLVKSALKNEGTCTGEHGVGLGKIKYLEQELGTPAIDLMKAIKATIDPQNIFNPGKLLRQSRDPTTGRFKLDRDT